MSHCAGGEDDIILVGGAVAVVGDGEDWRGEGGREEVVVGLERKTRVVGEE